MTRSTEELTRLLTGAADDIVERAPAPGPDTLRLWRQGRRVAWVARAAAVAIVAVVMALVAAGGVLVTGLPTTVPSDGGTLTYPEVVSDQFTGFLQAGSDPVFGLVATARTDSEPFDSLVIERRGTLASLGTAPGPAAHIVLSLGGSAPAVSPDGRRALTSDGIVDLDDGSVTRPVGLAPEVLSVVGSRGAWSPDSQHVLVSTVDGPAVIDGFSDLVFGPAAGDGEIRAAGWRGNDTVLGVRPSPAGGLDVVARGLADPAWQVVGTVAEDAVAGGGAPASAFASPDGSRLLLVYPGGASGPARSVLVDARTGARVPFTGETPSTMVAWDTCDPVWQAGQPLTALGGLHRPATGESVLSFSGHRELGCVALAGNALTGAPAPGAAGAWQERAWQLWVAALPFGGVLALAGAVWMALALRRSRKHGEDFLPMVLRLPF